MEIIRGKIPGAKKVVVYGPEGIGKSTFASRFPDPLFIDTEGSTKDMDVARTPTPSSWTMLLEQAEYVRTHTGLCKTLIIDTIDWAEQMCVEHVCALHQKQGIEDFGYGNGYVYVKEEFGRFLNKLSEVVNTGVHVLLNAHAQMRKFEQPDEMGAYDRWELKLGKKTTSQTSPLVKEWADMILFANYKTYSVAVDDKGKKRKAQGGSRVMYTTHHPCWDAKNRYGLPEEMPFEYAGIAHIIESSPIHQRSVENTPQTPVNERTIQEVQKPEQQPTQTEPAKTVPPEPAQQQTETSRPPEQNQEPVTQRENSAGDLLIESSPENVPRALKDLMQANQVSEWDIQSVVSARGYYPSDTRIENYDPDFINGVLVGAWPQVYEMIKHMKETEEVPFNN